MYTAFITTAKAFRTLTEDEREDKKDEIISSLIQVVDRMHPSHKNTLSYLMHHLKFIADNKQINQMSSKNLGES